MTTLRLAAFAVLLCAAAGAAAPAASAAPAREELDASFACASPAGWSAARRPDGVIFSAAGDPSGVNPVITVRYVGPDNKLYATVDAYMSRITAKPDVAIPGWKTGAVSSAKVAGRAAKRVVNEESDFVPPHALTTQEVPVREEHVAVPASRGFYVLVFRAPRAAYAAQRPIFARVLASFKPKL